MENTRRKKSGRGRLIFIAVIVVVVVIFALRFMQVGRVETIESIRSVQEAEGKPVEVAAAVGGDLEVWTTLAGTVEGSFQYSIISTNSIRVERVEKKEGDRVRPGDIIIRLEKTAPNPMLHSYNRSRAVYDDALATAERMRNLYREGAVSKQALDKAEMALKVAESDLTNARESTNLIATHAGVITSIDVEEGEMASAHKPLAWVARTDSVKMVFRAGSRQAMMLAKGQRAVWRSRATGESGEGVVSKLDLSADPETHLLRGEVCFPNEGGAFIPGLLVSFDVLVGERRGIVKIPTRCLMESQNGFTAYVAERGDDGSAFARLRAVETGLRTSDEVEILSGIEEGELVVEFGQTRLDDGDRVKIIAGGEGQ
jgi:RND family efflux transporter MFP subunit